MSSRNGTAGFGGNGEAVLDKTGRSGPALAPGECNYFVSLSLPRHLAKKLAGGWGVSSQSLRAGLPDGSTYW
ncbi:MAG: hypothetical protein ABGZ53_30390 [Fuerstiella sp.]